ncbi:MAG: hypothetical protein HQM00_02090 [Magnetococcales bacterium]|nr:hypothetical protein [Magnetococcales bacterium]
MSAGSTDGVAREAGQGAWLESAMNQALEADRRAGESVAESRRLADEILLQARMVAGEIEARADRRMAAIQKGRAKFLKRRLETLKRHQQRAAPFQQETTDALREPGEAARLLAARLTGAG